MTMNYKTQYLFDAIDVEIPPVDFSELIPNRSSFPNLESAKQ